MKKKFKFVLLTSILSIALVFTLFKFFRHKRIGSVTHGYDKVVKVNEPFKRQPSSSVQFKVLKTDKVNSKVLFELQNLEKREIHTS